jgi:hypothetical protein
LPDRWGDLVTTVVILQSNYIPWRGYFDLIRRADHFVFYDTAQYTKRDWRNRNRVVGVSGPLWLTIPVHTKGKYLQQVDETMISDDGWAAHHLSTLQHSLGQAPRYASYLAPRILEWYGAVAAQPSLSRINRFLVEVLMVELRLAAQLHNSADLPQLGDRTGRLVSMCQALGATRYLSGPSAQAYMDMEQFATAGIAVEWMEYPAYPTYQQMNGAFEPGVSILDALAHLAPEEVLG